MKNKKRFFIIGGSAIAVVFAVVLFVALTPKQSNMPEPPLTDESISAGDVIIEDPERTLDISELDDTSENIDTGEPVKTVRDDGSGLIPIEEPKKEQDDQMNKKVTDTVAKPEQEITPINNEPESREIVIEGNSPKPYDCDTPGHHCDGPETHAYVLNLELAGCPYCGMHDCPSFYATDEWGQTCYTPSKCPSYDIHKDPVHFCQKCGKPCGDGSSGTCAEYNIDIDCPLCGEHVEAWTCHSCE